MIELIDKGSHTFRSDPASACSGKPCSAETHAQKQSTSSVPSTIVGIYKIGITDKMKLKTTTHMSPNLD